MAGLPLVSYVLVNWRTEELLPRALQSIAAQSHGLREVLLVNNASPSWDESIPARFPDVQVIHAEKNLGFARGNNLALSQCRGDYIVLLNCDAYLDPGFTQRALQVMAANGSIGTVVPKILRDNGSGLIDSTGHLMHFDRTPAQRGAGELDQGQYNRGGFVFGGTAAAIMYRREMLAQVARPVRSGSVGQLGEVFDDAFFAYFEDVDLDWRAQLAGWLAYYEPACLAYHRGHGSGGRKKYSVQLQAEKNRYLMLARNDSLPAQWPSLPQLALFEGWHLLRTLLRPQLWPAYFALLWHLPRALAWRWQQARIRKRTAAAVAAQWFTRRGYQPPPKAQPPSPATETLLETAEEKAQLDEQLNGGYFPLVSVVLVNYNGAALTSACLTALSGQSYEPLEIIVVDNGSRVNEAEQLAAKHPGIRTLRLEVNQGFSGGVNWGVSLARGAYTVLLNNDALPDEDCIRRLALVLKQSGAGAVSGRLVDVQTPQQAAEALSLLDMFYSGDEIVGEIDPHVADALLESERNHGTSLLGFTVHDAYGTEPGCFYPSGGLCAFPRHVIDELGPELVPHYYFAYFEDVYLGYRLRALGHSVVKEPRAVAVHLASSTARKLGRPRLRFMQERNRGLNVLGWLPPGTLLKLMPLRALVECALGLRLLLTRPGDWLGWLGAHVWGWLHLPSVARWRRQCRRQDTGDASKWLGELSGQVRCKGGMLNALALGWCRLLRIPCRETTMRSSSDE